MYPTKILILGMPRTSTTQLQIQLSWLYRIRNLSEPFRVDKPGDPAYVYEAPDVDPYAWVAQQKNCTIKLLATDLFTIDMLKIIAVGNFDLIVLTHRKDITDCCLSLYVAEKINQYHHTAPPKISPFECDLGFVKDWLATHNRFYNNVATLDKIGTQYYTVDYDDYINNRPVSIGDTVLQINDSLQMPYLNTRIPYSELCVNYDQVRTLIMNHG